MTGGAARRSDLVLSAAGLLAFGVAVAAYTMTVLVHPHDLWAMSDLKVYRWGGLLARRSDHLYDRTTGGFAFTYPPVAAVIFAGLSVFPMAVLRWVMTLVSLAALVTAVWTTWRLAGRRRSPALFGATLLVTAAALWTEPVQKTLWFGQINLILMALVLTDLRQGDGRRWKGAGIGIATGIKFTPGIFIAYLLLTRRFRAAAVAIAVFLSTIVVGFVALPHESRQYWGNRLFMTPSRVGPTDWVGNQSLYGMLVRFFGGEHTARPYWLATVGVVGAAGLWLAARQSRSGREPVATLTCATTGLLISPISWSHHWVWIAPALVLIADRMAGPSRRAWVWAVGTAGLDALFGAWIFAVPGLPALPQGLIRTVPFGRHREDHWHGLELVRGNLYVLIGLAAILAILAILAVRRPRAVSPGRRRPGAGGSGDAGGRRERPPVVPEVGPAYECEQDGEQDGG
ncbi:glycosyltransferase 87 family protein [Actinoallomurus sp. NPDC052274]|uniref:glycosyltransferase 87 family protein n=1 Tax=Actinoallomurus sp. NPDC052274 TaxID=3155420 RepID=UPI003415A81B